MFQIKFDVYKITEMRDGCVYKTKRIKDDLWLDCKPRSIAEQNEIAKEHGGDQLSPTTDSRVI